MRLAEFTIVLPVLYAVLALRAAMPLHLPTTETVVLMALVFALVSWPTTARGVREIVAAERTLDYVAAAEALGAGPLRIMVRTYLASRPDPALYEFLRYDFSELTARYGGVVGTAFRQFPSFPQRYIEVAAEQPDHVEPGIRVEPLKRPSVQTRYTEDDLHVREFLADTSRRLVRTGQHRAA